MVCDFGCRLKDLRERKMMTQFEVAEKLKLTRSTVSAYERNIKTPSVEVLVRMAVLYNVSLDYMLCFDNRSNLYLDDLTDSQQNTILDIIKSLRIEFERKTF